MSLNMEIVWQRRLAIYTPSVDRPALGLEKDRGYSCRVWGCYQVNDGEDVNPYFVIELSSGRCAHAAPEEIRFIDEEDDE